MSAFMYGSVCSGIEAASVAWHPLGWRPSFFSEIESFPRAVLAHHYPDVPCHGDFTTIRAGDYTPIDLLVGGTPCQSFSVAGLRKGLDDPRGNLMLGFGALAQRLRPRWLVWENVPGVLSSNGGRDFGTFLGMLGILGYGFAYRVLDAQYFGVPQRRRRVFVVGCLGDWRPAAAVLFERHSLQGHPAPSREARKVAAAGTLRGTDGGSDVDHARAGHLVASGKQWPADVAPTLNAHFGDKQGLEDQHALGGQAYSYLPEISLCLNAGGMGRQDYETETLIGGGFDVGYTAHTMRGEGFDASEDGTGRGTPLVPVAFSIMPMNSGKDYKARPVEVTQPLMAGGPVGGNQGGDFIVQPVAFVQNSRDEVHLFGGDGGTVGALAAEAGAKQQCYIAFDTTQITSAVRRLTPTECERLQGFPDGYTLIPVRGKPAADGPRYKALGNSMAVPVMRWIGDRIQQADSLTSPRGQP